MNPRPASLTDMDEFEVALRNAPLMTYWVKHTRRSSVGMRYLNPEVDLIWIGYKIAKGLT